ncbi:MAG TPA: hypothetical protein VFV34_19885, partial [Blastocatellia bacterium]|nr:hypothetical protein [Blastocatellia bacterium]
MKVKRYLLLAVVAVALVSAALPVLGLRGVGAAGRAAEARVSPAPLPANPAKPAGGQELMMGQGQRIEAAGGVPEFQSPRAQFVPPGFASIGAPESMELAAKGMTMQGRQSGRRSSGDISPQSNEPSILAPSSAFSASLATTIGGRDTQFDNVEMLADWDGREDFVADREGKIDDFSQKIPPPGGDWTLTRVAISEHTIANGFNENVYYYGDSFGNVYVAQSPGFLTPSSSPGFLTGANIFSFNLPQILNQPIFAFGSLTSDDQITVTGLAVSPVCDLTSFANVNGAFASFAGLTG